MMTREQLDLYYPTYLPRGDSFSLSLLDIAQNRLPDVTPGSIEIEAWAPTSDTAGRQTLVHEPGERSMVTPALRLLEPHEIKTRLIRLTSDREDGLSFAFKRIKSNRSKHRGSDKPVKWGKEGLIDYLSNEIPITELTFSAISLKRIVGMTTPSLERALVLELSSKNKQTKQFELAQNTCLRGLEPTIRRGAEVHIGRLCKVANVNITNCSSTNIEEFLYDANAKLPITLEVGSVALNYTST